ncbi:hypothetical protein RchiOBHm_Chr5g0063911 [Rosa chinensis]|uniref:Uncharacterized protein n=1 Tax=Rosa chinensis TaxID=74649 RepID=A0A2P6QIJ8_ROSCH|nr:hypothetical protein RchiOBHm_Chr5g0063911 [Rosa chinensis]
MHAIPPPPPPSHNPVVFDSVRAKDDRSDEAGGSSIALKVVIVLLGVVAMVGFGVFLFRIWQRKKREEQHDRLLKLFEDDDELEVELGIRD